MSVRDFVPAGFRFHRVRACDFARQSSARNWAKLGCAKPAPSLVADSRGLISPDGLEVRCGFGEAEFPMAFFIFHIKRRDRIF
jgi:hypothetical protein